jgi:CRP-like cAMP-binding protein
MFLVMLRAHLFGAESHQELIPLVMSRSDIADFVALSREATSRASTELERRGLVEFQRGRTVRVVDDEKLTRLAAAV